MVNLKGKWFNYSKVKNVHINCNTLTLYTFVLFLFHIHEYLIITMRIRNIYNNKISFLNLWWLWKEPFCSWGLAWGLSAKSVEGSALPLQGVHYIHGCDGLAFGMFAVCDCITDDILEKHLQYTACLFVDQTGDPLDTTSPGKSSDCWFGNTLDVVSQHFAVSFCASLSESLSSFTASRHVADVESLIWRYNKAMEPKC